MTDRPIIFSSAMVQALIAGRKTQTRRLATSPLRRVEIGDRLYVRESSAIRYSSWHHVDGDKFSIDYAANFEDQRRNATPGVGMGIRAGKPAKTFPSRSFNANGSLRWCPSIHLPRWASRLTLIVEDARVEPLSRISDPDAEAEGLLFQDPSAADREWAKAMAEEEGGSPDIEGVWVVPGTDCGYGPRPRCMLWGCTPSDAYRTLWNSLHTNEGERWQDNPDVVALTFRVQHGNIDALNEDSTRVE